MSLLLIALCLCCVLSSLAPWAEAYQEHLTLRPLPQSQLLAAFDFRTNTSLSDVARQNYRLFPRSLGQILQHSHTRELHLRFSVGRWDAQSWGERPRHGGREGGTGVELWAWVDAASHAEANARWLTLSNALSGLFCASLNFIDSTKTIRPAGVFDLEGRHNDTSGLHLLHGALPHEVVCTENLTPFLKLLPCKAKAGVSTLLDGHKLFDASWQTMAIDVRPVCPSDGGECVLEIEQTVDMVLDLDRSMRPQDDPIPRPPPIEDIACDASKSYNSHDTCYPLHRTAERSWSLTKVFGRPIRGSCSLDASAPETVHLYSSGAREVNVTSEHPYTDVVSPDGSVRHYQLPAAGTFDISHAAQPLIDPLTLSLPRLHAERTIVGHGQERGGMRIILTNPSDSPASAIYLESLPWYMKPYLSTLSATLDGAPAPHSIQQTHYRPAIDRVRGTHLELRLLIPASSTLTLTYTFEKAILRYTEYPPDANRGFDVAPAVVKLLARGPGEQPVWLRTTSLLLPLPTPDFSMPYNVIILTSTVIAMAFGSVFNILVRRFVAGDEVDEPRVKVLREKVRAAVARVKQKLAAKRAPPAEKEGESKKSR